MLRGCRYLLHDRMRKFCQSFRELIKTGSVNPLRLPARSPNLNSYAERVRSVKEEFCEADPVWRIVAAASVAAIHVHYHEERNHQGKDNRILFLRGRRQGGTWEQCGVENDWAAC